MNKHIIKLITACCMLFTAPAFAATFTQLPNNFTCSKSGSDLTCNLPAGFSLHGYGTDAVSGQYELAQGANSDTPELDVASANAKTGSIWLWYQNVNKPQASRIEVVSGTFIHENIVDVTDTIAGSHKQFWTYNSVMGSSYNCKVSDVTKCAVVLN